MSDLVIRLATADDLPRVTAVQFGTPASEAVGFFGTDERARRFGARQLRRSGITDPDKPTLVACRDGTVVGMLQYRYGAGSAAVSRGDIVDAIAVAGPIRAIGLLPKLRARSRVDSPIPTDAFYLAEVHVDPDRRGGGIGGALLDETEVIARGLGASRIVLTTTIANPARRLYERKGYVVTDTREDAAYARFSGSPGRVRMERDLTTG